MHAGALRAGAGGVSRKALLLGALLLGVGRSKPTAEELAALRERCRKAELLELGQILHEARTEEARAVITAEINNRLGKEP